MLQRSCACEGTGAPCSGCAEPGAMAPQVAIDAVTRAGRPIDARDTNCVHAALVELKSGGAADYWMKGEARVPLSLIRGAYRSSPGAGGTPGTDY